MANIILLELHVERHDDPADGGHRGVNEAPFGAVLGEERGSIPFLVPSGDERRSEPRDERSELPVGDFPISRGTAAFHGDAGSVALDRLFEKCGEGISARPGSNQYFLRISFDRH